MVLSSCQNLSEQDYHLSFFFQESELTEEHRRCTRVSSRSSTSCKSKRCLLIVTAIAKQMNLHVLFVAGSISGYLPRNTFKNRLCAHPRHLMPKMILLNSRHEASTSSEIAPTKLTARHTRRGRDRPQHEPGIEPGVYTATTCYPKH